MGTDLIDSAVGWKRLISKPNKTTIAQNNSPASSPRVAGELNGGNRVCDGEMFEGCQCPRSIAEGVRRAFWKALFVRSSSSRVNTGGYMSIPDRQAEVAEWRQQQQDTGIIVGAVTLAIFIVPMWILGRAAVMFSSAPGRDLNGDGVSTISDILDAGRWSFFEPAWHALSWIPAETWRFFEVSTYNLPTFVIFIAAVICWIAIGIGLAVAGVFIGRGFVYLGKGASIGIGRVQMRLPNLMPMDIIIITAVVIVVGGFALGALINTLS